MTNDELKALIQALEAGEKNLGIQQQLELARKLLRANHRIQAARRAGFVEKTKVDD